MARATLHRWRTVPQKQLSSQMARRVIGGQNAMLALYTLRKGCQVPPHAHPHEQMSYVLRGRLRFVAGGEEFIVGAGEVLHLPPNVAHQAEALESTLDLDVFSPIREDFLADRPT